jgi:RecA DNA recombination protein
MRAVVSKAEIESEIASRFGSALYLQVKRQGEVISTGVPEIDSFTLGGLPRGAITEIFGPASSGRTSFMLSAFAYASNHEEICAVVDASNAFAPQTATQAGINCDRLLWIRCGHNLEHAFKATDLLLQGGGFGLVLLDLGDVPANSAKRIISSWWYRFRRTLEPTPTALVVIAEESCVRPCATLALELNGETSLWSTNEEGTTKLGGPENNHSRFSPAKRFPAIHPPKNSLPHATLFGGFAFQVECRRPLYFNKRAEEVVAKARY